MLLSIAVDAVMRGMSLGVTVLRKCFGRNLDLRIKGRIIRTNCHDLGPREFLEVFSESPWMLLELQSRWVWFLMADPRVWSTYKITHEQSLAIEATISP